jgi:hypothetical protein
MSYGRKLPASLAALAVIPLSLSAASFSLNPISDAFVTTGPATNDLTANNYGGAGALSVAAPGLPKGEFQSVLQFDLSAARNSFDTSLGAGQWSLQSVTLRLSATSPLNAIFNSSTAGQFNIIWMQNDTWLEGTGFPGTPSNTGITFTSLQNSFTSGADQNLGSFNYNGATSGNTSYLLTLASSLASEVQSGNIVSLRLTAGDAAVSYLFDSRNFPNASLEPLLTVTVTPVPEPGSLSLFALGCAWLLFSWSKTRLRGTWTESR